MPIGAHSFKKALFLVVNLLILLSFFYLLPCPSAFASAIGEDAADTRYRLHDELFSPDNMQSDPKTATFNLAQARFKQGLWEESVRHANTVLSVDSNHGGAHGVLGTIYALTGNRTGAEKELAFLKNSKTGGFYPDLIEAVLKAQAGQVPQAVQHIDAVLQKSPDHPVATYYAGSLNLAQRNLPEAEKRFRRVLEFQPEFTPALAGLAQVYLQQANMAKAAEYYQQAARLQPEVLFYRKQLIDIYKTTGQKDAAEREMKQALYYTPGVKQSYLARGKMLLAEGSYKEAIGLMNKVIKIYTHIPEALYIKAAAQINLGQDNSAAQNVEAFIRQRWASPQGHHFAGMCYLAMQRLDLAERQFKIGITLAPNGRSFVPLVIIEHLKGNYDVALGGLRVAKAGGEPPALIHYLLSHILLAKGDEPKYNTNMKQAVELIPGLSHDTKFIIPKKSQRALFSKTRNLMVIFFYNGWYGKALELSQKLIGLNKNDRFAWFYKALSERAHKDVENARTSLQKLLRIEPNLISAQMEIGRLNMEMADFANARKAFNKVIDTNPSYTPAYVSIGDVYLREQRVQNAIYSYSKAIEIDPNNFSACHKLALLFSEDSEKLDEALKFAKMAQDIAPEHPGTLDAIGWVYIQKNEIKKGLPKLKAASEHRPNDPLIQYHLGVAYYKNNDLQAARQALQNAISNPEGFNGRNHAQAILKEISQ